MKQYFDTTRIDEFWDTDLLANKSVSICGVGGSTGAVEMLARCGVGKFVLTDPDVVEAKNLTNQCYRQKDIDKPKVEATKELILSINPSASVITQYCKYQERDHKWVEPSVHSSSSDLFWESDIVLSMTDDFKTQAQINSDSFHVKLGSLVSGSYELSRHPVIFAGCYEGMTAAEIIFVIPTETSCYRCQAKGRYEAYESGNIRRIEGRGSNILAGQYRNTIVAHLAISLLLKGTKAPIAKLAVEYMKENMLVAKLLPEYQGILNIFSDKKTFSLLSYEDNDSKCPVCSKWRK